MDDKTDQLHPDINPKLRDTNNYQPNDKGPNATLKVMHKKKKF